MLRALALTGALIAIAIAALPGGVAGSPPPVENADIDENGYVNSVDQGLLRRGEHPRADVNRDGALNSLDVGFVAANYGAVRRDKYRHPFASNSIWNTSIGGGAVYADTDFQLSRDYTVIDVDHWVVTSSSDPLLEIMNDRSVWGGPRCSSTVASGKFTRMPQKLTVPDVGGGYYPNNAAAILQPDGRTIVQVNALARCTAGGAVYGVPAASSDIYGPGQFGGHGGSGLSSIGGTVRLGELTGNRPIHHVLKVNIPCELYCSPQAGPGGGNGWRWPAATSDNFCGTFACGYGGTLPYLQMGSLLALPATVHESTITAPGQPWAPGMETAIGKKLLRAFRDYGAYVVDDLQWNGSAYALHVERGVHAEVLAATGIDIDDSTPTCSGVCGAYWRDWHRIWMNLQVVTSNGPSAIGGGGAPRVPTLPPIGN